MKQSLQPQGSQRMQAVDLPVILALRMADIYRRITQ